MTTIINQLRQLIPDRALADAEARSIAERQATRLLELTGTDHPTVPSTIISHLPRIAVTTSRNIQASGQTTWTRGTWNIQLNAHDHPLRQRFSLAHELKHIIDHPHIDRLYPNRIGQPDHRRAETICDYFAACLLMPRPWVTAAYTTGTQDPHQLANLFNVSPAAMTYRLNQLGLTDSTPRCRTYLRDAPLGSVA